MEIAGRKFFLILKIVFKNFHVAGNVQIKISDKTHISIHQPDNNHLDTQEKRWEK